MVNIMVQWMMTGLIAVLHPFFVSVIEINHNQKEATVEISVRVFTEDLEKTLQKYNTVKLDIINPADKVFLEKQISNYIMQKIKLKINGRAYILNYVGYEIQKESIWTYFEITKVPEAKKIEVDCSLLYDFEKNQTNLFHVKSNGVEKSFKLDYPASAAVFNF